MKRGSVKPFEAEQTDTEDLNKKEEFFSAFNLLAFLSYIY